MTRGMRYMLAMALFAFSLFVGSSSPVLAAGTERSVDPRPDCFSCLIKVSEKTTLLPEEGGGPTLLSGSWLFNKGGTDDYAYGDEELDTKDWKLVHAPGTWTKAFDDGQPFRTGWYRGVIQWQADQIGKDFVLLLSSRLSRVTVFLDGKEIYRRPGNFSIERYFANQPIPVSFKAGNPMQSIAFKIEAITQDGVYELPFEIRRYSTGDHSLTWHQYRGGELRLTAGAIVFFFGLFFLLVYVKLRSPMYLTATLSSFAATPYLVLPTDVALRTFDPEPMLFLHHLGLTCVFFFSLFCQNFDKYTPKFNWVMGIITFGSALVLASFPFFDISNMSLVDRSTYNATEDWLAGLNLNLFEIARKTLNIANIVLVLTSIWHTLRGTMQKRDGALVLLVGMVIFAALFGHDVLMSRGFFESTAMVPLDNIVFAMAMIWVASSTFASTYKDNVRLVTDLKGINDNLEHIVSERTAQLREKTNDIQNMLENMPQGILTIVSGGKIHPEYSKYLEAIYESSDIAGRSAMGLLFDKSTIGSDAKSAVEATIDAVIGEDRMNFDFNTHLLATGIDLAMPDGRVKYLDMAWSPICDETDTVDKLMVCVRDVTELRKLEAEAGQQKRELEMIGQILTVNQEKFHEFIDSSRNFVIENEGLIKQASDKNIDLVTQLFRNMHTIKGNARTYGLLHLTNIVHESEQAYDELRKNPEAEFNKDALLAQLQDVLNNIEEYASLNEVKLGRKGPGRRGSAEKYVMVKREQVDVLVSDVHAMNVETADRDALVQTIKKIELNLRLIGTETIQSILDGVFDSLPSLARELGKESPALVVQDNSVFIRNQIADLLRNVFMHLYRNSMDHGIETAADRLAKHKPAAGTITLTLAVVDGQLTMRLKDDGKGLALSYIRQKGIEKGLIETNGKCPDEEVAMLIFAPGFSTAAAVTEVSGRGVGMDAVQDFVKREGGHIVLQFSDSAVGADYRAFETVITMPGQFAVDAS
jgi:HPt (histidine-containing phosphotransfer) domain-containing protein